MRPLLDVLRHTEGLDSMHRRRILFRPVPLFDVGQTDPVPGAEAVPLKPTSEPITGDSHADLPPRLEGLAGELGTASSSATSRGRRARDGATPERG